MSDSLNTTITVVVTLQSEVMEYNFIKLNYLNMIGWGGQFFGIYAAWHLQRKYSISSKTMWVAVSFGIVVLDVWGMIGIWNQRIGYHHTWEFWLFQVWWGVAVSPYYSYCQIMVSTHIPSPSPPHAPFQKITSTSSLSGISSRSSILVDKTKKTDLGSHPARERVPLFLLL